jgi:hypothetical protein
MTKGRTAVLPLRVWSHRLPYHRVQPREAPGVHVLADRPPCLAARDALGSEVERHIGGFAATDGDVLGLRGDLAVTDEVRAEGVDVAGTGRQRRADEHAAFRSGTGRVAVHAQRGVGGQIDDDGGRSGDLFGTLLRHRLLFAGADLFRGRAAFDDRAAACADGRAAATIAMEQSAVAAIAAIARRNGMTAIATAVAAVAAKQPAAEQSAVATMTAAMAAIAARHDCAAAARAVAPIATVAEVNRLGAAAQGHHENNTVHFGNLLQQQREPTQAEIFETSRAWSLGCAGSTSDASSRQKRFLRSLVHLWQIFLSVMDSKYG